MSEQLFYPDFPGYKSRGGTSQEAAEAIAPKVATIRAKVLRAFLAADAGLTADEVAGALGLTVLTIRPRVSELRLARVLVDSGLRRANQSGKSATVWKINKGGADAR
ncbi:MAG: hypothetical protein H0T60_10305 [Acidobacteria bacterium]|nr:hypothetical protein [Acidobacteriota bacterium]